METVIITGLAGLFGIVLTGIVTLITKRSDRAEHDVDRLLEGYRHELDKLGMKVDLLETNAELSGREMTRQRELLSEQGMELYIIRARELDLRSWAREVSAWCQLAVTLIQSLGSNIADPPPIPRMYSPDSSEEKP